MELWRICRIADISSTVGGRAEEECSRPIDSGGRMYKPVAAYSRTRRRGRSLKISIRDFHCNERRAPIAAHRQEAFNFMQIDDGHRCERRAKHIPRPVHACLLLKCLHRPFRFPKYTGYCGFFEHRSSKRENFLSPNIFFLPFPFFSSYNIAYENCPLSFYRRKENEFELERFFPAPAIYSLLLENLEMIQRCIGYVNIRDVEKK